MSASGSILHHVHGKTAEIMQASWAPHRVSLCALVSTSRALRAAIWPSPKREHPRLQRRITTLSPPAPVYRRVTNSYTYSLFATLRRVTQSRPRVGVPRARTYAWASIPNWIKIASRRQSRRVRLVCRVKSSREGVRNETNEGGSDLVQVAEMHDPNTGAVQVCAGGVSHWPLLSSVAQSGFKHAVARSRKEALSPEGCAKRKCPSRVIDT